MNTIPFAFQSEWYSRWEGKSTSSPHLKLSNIPITFDSTGKKSLFELERSKRINLTLQKRVKIVQKRVRYLLFQQRQCLIFSLILFVFSIVPVHRLLHYSALKGKFCIQFGIIIPIWSHHAPLRRHLLCKWVLPELGRVHTKNLKYFCLQNIYRF